MVEPVTRSTLYQSMQEVPEGDTLVDLEMVVDRSRLFRLSRVADLIILIVYSRREISSPLRLSRQVGHLLTGFSLTVYPLSRRSTRPTMAANLFPFPASPPRLVSCLHNRSCELASWPMSQILYAAARSDPHQRRSGWWIMRLVVSSIGFELAVPLTRHPGCNESCGLGY